MSRIMETARGSIEKGRQLAGHARSAEVVGHLGRVVNREFGGALEHTVGSIKTVRAGRRNTDSTRLDTAINATRAVLAILELSKVVYNARKRQSAPQTSVEEPQSVVFS